MISQIPFIFDEGLPLDSPFLFWFGYHQADMFETGEVFTAENTNLIRLAHFTEEFFRISLRLLHCEWVLVTPYQVKILQTNPTFLRFRQKIETIKFFLFFRCLKYWLFFVVSEICACSQSI